MLEQLLEMTKNISGGSKTEEKAVKIANYFTELTNTMSFEKAKEKTIKDCNMKENDFAYVLMIALA